MFTFSTESLFLNSTIADKVGVVVSSVTMIGPRLKRKEKISLVNTPFQFVLGVLSPKNIIIFINYYGQVKEKFNKNSGTDI